jgi:membrane protease YdiL (CAAX protease family)
MIGGRCAAFIGAGVLACALLASPRAWAGDVSPALVGWGNTFVPGLGATLLGRPWQGGAELGLSVGAYVGGAELAKDGAFTIDGSVLVPLNSNVTKPLVGQILQEFGLKYHMWNTFHHYQEASLDPSQEETQRHYQQPLYRGDWKDVLFAPFKWKNISTAWTYVPVLASTLYLFYSYNTTTVTNQGFRASPGQEVFYGLTQGVVIPLGSSFGEEVMFRGFVQRELHYYTGSALLAIAGQTLLFTAIHPPELRAGAAVGGAYFGFSVDHFDGDLEPAIATHFWIDLVGGGLEYLLFRKVQGKSVPFAASLQIPF